MSELAASDRIVSLDAATAWRRTLRGSLVFTNGVFDILHSGHLELLMRARAFGDALLVAVNSDASVRGLDKGSDRPVVPQEERALALAALRVVDRVVIFDDPTPVQLIAALLPNVLVKGGDYAADNVVGSDVVRLHGGRVEIVPLVADRSTTRFLERLRGSS